MNQLSLFDDDLCAIEQQVQAILERRRRLNCSGANGEDIALIRAAIKAAHSIKGEA